MQSQRISIQSELEDIGQRATLQSSDQNMQTLCSRKIFHPEEASPCKSKPPPRNWNFLPTHQEFSFEECQKSESAWLVEKLSPCLNFVLFLSTTSISICLSPEDWGSASWNRSVENKYHDLRSYFYIFFIYFYIFSISVLSIAILFFW